MASRVPAGSHGVMPIFSDAMHFKQWYHAAPSFINLSIDPEKCNKATLFRALEENAAIVSACNLAQISQFSGVTFESLVFAGGGSKGALWSQILSDVTGLRCGCRWSAKPPRWAAPSPPEPAPGCMMIWPAPESG
ncbi:Autoinducer 2 (AI-2) kinase LsrK [Klebsiella pneumoniae]|uniref:Autoinducer 2 (AI-2) kinase LsrK n=1 Tax=Klebsiella pneumoniae TaxID=573 RepID=A0A2X3CVM6_KLEPN|nr:Autoinducer 2 (AI-2) kinase LsrK [Klebsiella pneumoniae]